MNYIFSLCRPWKLVLSANYLKPTCDFFPTAKNIVKCNYKMSSSSSDLIEDQPVKGDTFHSKKALILTKFSRYEFEKRTNPNLTEEQLIDKVCGFQILLDNSSIITNLVLFFYLLFIASASGI